MGWFWLLCWEEPGKAENRGREIRTDLTTAPSGKQDSSHQPLQERLWVEVGPGMKFWTCFKDAFARICHWTGGRRWGNERTQGRLLDYEPQQLGAMDLLIPELEGAEWGAERFFKREDLFLRWDQRFHFGHTESILNMQCGSMST